MKNRVKKYRQAMKLSQRRLAELVGTSQQQIQRLETGSAPVRLDIGANISKALQQPLNVLFPGSEKALKKINEERKNSRYLELDAWDEMRETGLEPDPRMWTIKMGLRGYGKPLYFEDVPAIEKASLFKQIQGEENTDPDVSPFVVFDTAERRVAINLRELDYCHFLFDRSDLITLEPEDSAADAGSQTDGALVYLVGGGEPLSLALDVDEQFDENDEEMGMCSGVFFDLQLECHNARRILLTDQDGEKIFIRAGNLAMLDVPLWVIEPPDYEDD